MDKEQARFILRSYRPDGADVSDPDFAEALALAMENRELGEWLASERAFDAAFAAALGSVDLPEHLHAEIVACLAVERGDFPQAENHGDAAFIGAFASIHPPAFMREELIAAMDRTAVAHRPKAAMWRRAGIPLAAAAGIAMAFIFTETGGHSIGIGSSQVRAEVVQAGFIKELESPSFYLEEKREDKQLLVQHLRERQLPCPGCLPPGLVNVKGLGCRELVINGKRGSVICFDRGPDGIVHLMVFNRSDVEGDFPDRWAPRLNQQGRWASAQWKEGKKIFILLGNTDATKLAALL